MSEEVDPEMLLDFIAEARPGLDQVEHDLLMAERDPGARIECLDRVFRTMHSIKGNGGFLGLRVLVRLAHEAETVMDAMRSGKLDISTEVMDAIFATTDKLLAYIELADHSLLTISEEECAGSDIDPAMEIKALQQAMHGEPKEVVPEKQTSRAHQEIQSAIEDDTKLYEAKYLDLPKKPKKEVTAKEQAPTRQPRNRTRSSDPTPQTTTRRNNQPHQFTGENRRVHQNRFLRQCWGR
jgi:chemotaxis protein histidine kinase CheA